MSPRSSLAGSLSPTLSILESLLRGGGGGLSPASAGVSLTCPPVAQKSPPQRVLPLTKSTFYPGQRTLPHSAGAPAAGSPVSRVPLRPELTHGCLPSASSRHASPPNSPPLSLRPLTCAAGSSAARSPWCCRQPPRPPQCSILPKPALQTLPHFRFPPLPEAARGGGGKATWVTWCCGALREARNRSGASRAASSGSSVSDSLSLTCLWTEYFLPDCLRVPQFLSVVRLGKAWP